MRLINDFFCAVYNSFKDSVIVCRNLYPMIIPIVILVKVLQELGLVKYVAMPLAFIMELMGLPAELGIVWAAAMLLNIYSAIVLLPGIMLTIPPLTVEQVTVLGLVILIAHSLILEIRIAGKCGLSMRFQLFLRFFVAIFAGVSLHYICDGLGVLQGQAVIFLEQEAPRTLMAWALAELWSLVQIFVLIAVVMLMNRGLNQFRISQFIGFVLSPILRMLGISKEATNIVIVGLVLGLLYGSGVIIQSATEGKISNADSFATVSLMGIAHALIEDTLLLMLIGGSIWGLLVYRVAVAIFVGATINVLYSKKKFAVSTR